MTVRDYMEIDLLPVSPSDTCDRALALMDGAAVDALPVLEAGRLVGTVSEIDIRRRAPRPAAANGAPDALYPHVHVSGVMAYAPVSIDAAAEVADAAAMMLDRGVSSLAVVEHDRLVGVVTTRAILRAFTDLLRGVRAERGNAYRPSTVC